MIGNDIVDLAFAQKESNWKRPRFLEKLFTLQEHKYILDSQQADKMVWLLWSMKESAYKLHEQLFGKRFYAPKNLVCSITELNDKGSFGEVVCADFQCFTQSYISNEFIYTFSKMDKNEDHLGQIFFIDNSSYKAQHEAVDQKTKAHIAKCLGTSPDEIRIQKNSLGVPFFYFKKQKLKVAVSTTHHGNYGAFAYNNVL